MTMAKRDYRRELIELLAQAWEVEQYPSLTDLAFWIECDIKTAERHLLALEAQGLVRIQNRGRNRIDGSRWRVRPPREQDRLKTTLQAESQSLVANEKFVLG